MSTQGIGQGDGEGRPGGLVPQNIGSTSLGAGSYSPPPAVGQAFLREERPSEEASSSELQRYWQIIRNHRGLVAGVFAAVVTGVGIGTYLQDPVYRASGVIEISKQGADVMQLEALFELARISDQHLQTEYGVMRSPALARRVVAQLGLAQEEEFARGIDAPIDRTDAIDEEVVHRFLKHLSVSPVEESRLVRVSFESKSPERAASVVNAVLEGYMALRAEASRATVNRLADQADSVRSQLTQSEKRLQQFVRDNEMFMAETDGGSKTSLLSERLRLLQEQLTLAEADNFAAEARWSEARGESQQVLGSRVNESLATTLAELQAEYAKLSATFTDSFPRVAQIKRQIASLERQMNGERTRVQGEIGGQYRATNRRLESLRRAFNEQKATAERMADLGSEYSILKRDAQGLEELYALLRTKEKEADVSAAMALTDIKVVDAAVPPPTPVRPIPERNIPLAALAGLLLGICAAFLREHTDSKVRRVEELEDMNVPILALIPSASSERAYATLGRGSSSTMLSTLLPRGPGGVPRWVRIDGEDWRRSALAEGFGNLRTSVLFSGAAGTATRSLLVTSVQAGEGKTTVSMNLAISLARLGRRVLLVDGDLRRPSVHRALKLPEGPGLSDHLSGQRAWEECAADVGVPNLAVLTCGGPVEAPAELLSSDRMSAFLRDAQAVYDFVVIDSPALMVNVADARILTSYADGIVMVVRGGVTPREVLRRLLGHIPNVVGVVLNDLEASQLPSYYGDYRSKVVEVEDPLAGQAGDVSGLRRAAGGEG